jgi:hypothetical protein
MDRAGRIALLGVRYIALLVAIRVLEKILVFYFILLDEAFANELCGM